MEKKLKRINRARSELLAFGKFRKNREHLLGSCTKNRNRKTGNLYYQQGDSGRIAFENDLEYRKILEVYDACFQDLHDKFLLKGKLYIMETLLSGFIQAGLEVEKVGCTREMKFCEDSGDGFLLVEGKILVGTAFLDRLSGSEILRYLNNCDWTDIDVVFLSVRSENPEWLALDKSLLLPASWEDISWEDIPDLDEPDEYWLYMASSKVSDPLAPEEDGFHEKAGLCFPKQDQPTASETEAMSERDKTDTGQTDYLSHL